MTPDSPLLTVVQRLHDLVVLSLANFQSVERADWLAVLRQLREHLMPHLELPNTMRKNHVLLLFGSMMNLVRSHLILGDLMHCQQLRADYVQDPRVFLGRHLRFYRDFDTLAELLLPRLAGTPNLQLQLRLIGASNLMCQQHLLYHVMVRMDSDPVMRTTSSCARIMQLQRLFVSKSLKDAAAETLARLGRISRDISVSIKSVLQDTVGLVFCVRFSLDFLTFALQMYDRVDQLGLNANYVAVVLLDLATALNSVTFQSDFPALHSLCLTLLQTLINVHSQRISPTLIVLLNNHSFCASSRGHLAVNPFATPPEVPQPQPQKPAPGGSKRRNSGQLFALRLAAEKKQRRNK